MLESDLLQEAIAFWGKYQIDMIIEETSELMVEMNQLNKLIVKLRRKSNNSEIQPHELMDNNDFRVISAKIAEEMTDVIVVLSQFHSDFEAKMKSVKKIKLKKLEDNLMKSREEVK